MANKQSPASNNIINKHNLVYLSNQHKNSTTTNNNKIANNEMAVNPTIAGSQKQKFKLIPPLANGSPDHQSDQPQQQHSPLSSSSLQSITTTDSETSIELSAATGNRNNGNNTLQDDQRRILINNNNNNNGNSKQQLQTARNGSQSKSPPILIKYNYYDYNGDRQEQTNQDMHFNGNNNNNNNKITRQLSPTFKQNLDQIVRNSQQYLMSTNTNQNSYSPNDSPRQMSPTNNNQFNTMMLARRYKMSSYEQRCLRCRKTVYQMDKVGPLKDFTFYHQNCFKCLECGTKLTLKTYFNNQHSSIDQEVYCHRHCPKTPAGKLDNQSVGIRAALNAPKVFDVHQMLANGQLPAGQQHQHHHHNFVLDNLNSNNNNNNNFPLILNSVNQMIANNNNHNQLILSPNNKQHVAGAELANAAGGPPNVDSSALYIQHAVQQTKLQAIYKQSQVDKKISQFLNKRLEYLEPRQKMLEMRHREEEEQLFKQFEQKWRQEETSISEQIRQEWQLELNKLIEKYKQQLSNIHLDTSKKNQQQATSQQNNNNNNKHHLELMGDLRRRVEECEDKLTTSAKNAKQQHQLNGSGCSQNEQQMIELERMNLEKTMTIKLDRKKLTLKRKLKEFERQATAELVERQSREMLTLISMKLEEFKEEQKRKIGSELEQFEAIESLANQLGASLQIADDLKSPTHQHNNHHQHHHHHHQHNHTNRTQRPLVFVANKSNGAPSPRAPKTSKMELYNSEQPDEVFKEIDQLAINVAREDQQTFTDLVHHLTRNCLTDVEKVRAIFRWITVKNLNTMQFDDPSIKPDTPLGLLRGIKQGSESYHVLFKRLCSLQVRGFVDWLVSQTAAAKMDRRRDGHSNRTKTREAATRNNNWPLPGIDDDYRWPT